jgi:hypothetical protein
MPYTHTVTVSLAWEEAVQLTGTGQPGTLR